LGEIDAKIENLMRLREALLSLSENCDDGTAACPMLDALMKDGFGDGEPEQCSLELEPQKGEKCRYL
jgi:MerR family mercuric resistance operon transcriptional regulator